MVDFDPADGLPHIRPVKENIQQNLPKQLLKSENCKSVYKQVDEEAELIHRRALKQAILEYILQVLHPCYFF